MYQVMVKQNDKWVLPKIYHKELSNEYMNGDCNKQQARYWRQQILKMMKNKIIPKSEVFISINTIEFMKRKLSNSNILSNQNKSIPVIEGEDPLAV